MQIQAYLDVEAGRLAFYTRGVVRVARLRGTWLMFYHIQGNTMCMCRFAQKRPPNSRIPFNKDPKKVPPISQTPIYSNIKYIYIYIYIYSIICT